MVDSRSGRCSLASTLALAHGQRLVHVVDVARPARGDHRHRHALRDAAQHLDVIARAGAIAIHAGDQQLTGAQLHGALCVLQAIELGGARAAVGVDLPGISASGVAQVRVIAARVGHAPHVTATNEALRAEALGALG